MIQVSLCDVCGVDLNETGTHYHCGNCTSKDVTSYMGHYQSSDGKEWGFTCDPKDVINSANAKEDIVHTSSKSDNEKGIVSS